VIIEPAEEEVMVPAELPPVAPAAAALKVVDVKPQELITSSMSVTIRQ
jgi:hypothetical protein